MPKLKIDEINELIAITPEEIARLSYEEGMALLEKTVAALEQEGTPLELGAKLYELGTLLNKKCSRILDSTEEKMFQLLGDIEDGSEEPFDPEKDGR